MVTGDHFVTYKYIVKCYYEMQQNAIRCDIRSYKINLGGYFVMINAV